MRRERAERYISYSDPLKHTSVLSDNSLGNQQLELTSIKMLSCLRMRAPACTSACASTVTSILPPKTKPAEREPPKRRLHAIYNLKSKRNASSALPPSPEPARTSLYDYHVEHGGKMVPFAGFLLPIQYNNDPVLASHVHTRTQGCASLFDVSHMLQTTVRGRDKDVLLETLTPADIRNLRPGAATLTVFTDPLTGGILDDLVASRTHEDTLFIVSNAGRRQHDSALLAGTAQELTNRGMDVSVEFNDPKDSSLLALQGNGAAAALAPLVEGVDLTSIYFMQTARATVSGIPVRLTRCGYTGEDGFEIAVPSDCARQVADALLRSKAGHVRLAGLGARDSLRLEAGLCLYGVDIDHTTTPVEAGLTWLIAKRRREEADFPGASVILKQIRDGPARKRVGLTPLERGPPARANTAVYAQGQEDADPVGHVTSGSPSPTLNTAVAMGYVRTPYAKRRMVESTRDFTSAEAVWCVAEGRVSLARQADVGCSVVGTAGNARAPFALPRPERLLVELRPYLMSSLDKFNYFEVFFD